MNLPTPHVRLVSTTLLVMFVMAMPKHAWANGEANGKLTLLSQTNQSAQLRFTAATLPAGVTLEAKSVRVDIAGEPVPVTATLAGTAATVTRRTLLVFDTSGSMAGAGIAAARQAADAFLNEVPDDVRVGLVAFSDRPHLLVPPTHSRARLRQVVAGLSAGGETALYDAIAYSLSILGGSGERSLVVLSDGADTRSRTTASALRADLARSGVRVDAVALRTTASVRTSLANLTSATDGVMTAAANASELAAAFSSAAATWRSQLVLDVRIPAQDLGRDVTLDALVATTVGPIGASLAVHVGSAPATPPTTATPGPRPQQHIPWLVLGSVFLGFAGLSYAGALLLADRRSPAAQARRLLSRYTVVPAGLVKTSAGTQPSRSLFRRLVDVADRIAADPNRKSRTELRLARANVSLTPGEWLVTRILLAVGAGALAMLLFRSLVLGVLLAVLSGMSCGLWLHLKARRRLKAFEEHLPGSLQLVASSLRAGFSLAQALDSVVHEGVEPISGEMHRALAEARLGMPLEDALDGVADRMDSLDFRWVVMAIRIQREVGGNLAEILLNTTTVMRERGRLRRQVRALSAEGRLSAYVLLGLPLLVSSFLVAFRRPYIRPLYTQPAGIGMLVLAVVLLVVGGFWMRKVVTVEA